jgi:hypothetical protein
LDQHEQKRSKSSGDEQEEQGREESEVATTRLPAVPLAVPRQIEGGEPVWPRMEVIVRLAERIGVRDSHAASHATLTYPSDGINARPTP